MKRMKKTLALLLALLMLCGLLPTGVLAAEEEPAEQLGIVEPVQDEDAQPEAQNTKPEYGALSLGAEPELGAGSEQPEEAIGSVRVIIRNDTYSVLNGAAWDGVLVSTNVEITASSTMMSCVVAALGDYSETGAESGYISEINGLSAGDGGAMSGWMGTLNDWFTSEGFDAYTVAAGTLQNGDEICICYSLDYGADVGSSWDNNDKTLSALTASIGVLTPAFSPDTHAYTLTVPAGASSVKLTPTAVNKNFQVRAAVGAAEYKRTAYIPVTDGTVITVTDGDPAWPSMNNAPYGTADSVPAEVYTITVAVAQPVNVTVGISDGGSYASDKNGMPVAEAALTLQSGLTDTIDGALIAVHDLLYSGGAAAGYETADSAWGLSITKLWGVANGGSYGYMIRRGGEVVMPMSLADKLQNGDHIDFLIYQNAYPDTEAYAFFAETAVSAVTNESFTVKLIAQDGYDASWNPVFAPCAGAAILLDGVATAAVTDDNGEAQITVSAAGTHTVTAQKFLTGGTGSAITATLCTVSVHDQCVHNVVNGVCTLCGAKEVTVRVVPATAAASFYSNAACTLPLPAGDVSAQGVSGKYNMYKLVVSAGTYYYRGTEGETDLGIGRLDVSAPATVTLVRHNFYPSFTDFDEVGEYTISGFTDKTLGAAFTLGAPYLNSGKIYYAGLLTAGHSFGGELAIREEFLKDYFLNAWADFTTKDTVTAAQNKSLPIAKYKTYTLIAPSDAESVEFYYQRTNYVVELMSRDDLIVTPDAEAGTTTYQFKSKTVTYNNSYSWRVSKTGEVTQAGFMKADSTNTVTWGEHAPTDVASRLTYDDNSVLLNIDANKSTNELAMQVGDQFKLRAFRNGWEIISDVSGNKMIEPDFHFAVLGDTDAIRVEPVTDQISGNAKGNWMNITALKPGVAVITVWYDGIDIYNSTVFNTTNDSDVYYYGATDAARYGYAIVTVGSDASVAVTPLSADGNWDAEFDTVYYTGSEGKFRFTAPDATAVSVTSYCGASAVGTRSAELVDGTWVVPVLHGGNVIAVTGANGTDYRLIRAKRVGLILTNNTTGVVSHDPADFDVRVGDSITVALDCLDMPVPKMSGIYNPGWQGTCFIQYQINGASTVYGRGTQYNFPTLPYCSVSFLACEAGTLTLTDGAISCNVLGDNPGSHRNITDAGKGVNTAAPSTTSLYGLLPEVQLNVKSGSMDYSTLTALDSVNLYVGKYNGMGTTTSAQFTTAKDNNSTAWSTTPTGHYLGIKATPAAYNATMQLRWWYEGESIHVINVPAGEEIKVEAADGFTADRNKQLNLELIVTPGDGNSKAAKVYSFVVMGGSGNLKYVHPVMTALSAVDQNGRTLTLVEPLSYTRTDYILNVGNARSISLNAGQLQKVVSASVNTQDKADTVTVTRIKNGAALDAGTVVAPATADAYPVGSWSLPELDITGADELDITVQSYSNAAVSRTYRVILTRGEPTIAGRKSATVAVGGELALDTVLGWNTTSAAMKTLYPLNWQLVEQWDTDGSTAEDIVTLADGTLTALAEGAALLRVSSADFALTSELMITVIPAAADPASVTGVELSGYALSMNLAAAACRQELALSYILSDGTQIFDMADVASAELQNSKGKRLPFALSVDAQGSTLTIEPDGAGKGSFKGYVVLTMADGNALRTNSILTITVTNKAPSFKAQTVTLNSYYTAPSAELKLASSMGRVSLVELADDVYEVINGCLCVKSGAAPAAKKLTLTVTVEGYKPVSAAVKVKVKRSVPTAKLSPAAVQMKNEAGAHAGLTLTLKNAAANSLTMAPETKGYTMQSSFIVESFNAADGSVTLRMNEPVSGKSGKLLLRVGIAGSENTIDVPVKLGFKPAALSLKLAKSSLKLNTAIGTGVDSASAALTLSDLYLSRRLTAADISVTMADGSVLSGLDWRFANGKLTFVTNNETDPAVKTIKLLVSAAGAAKPVKLSVQLIAKAPVLTAKVKGKLDVLNPDSELTAALKLSNLTVSAAELVNADNVSVIGTDGRPHDTLKVVSAENGIVTLGLRSWPISGDKLIYNLRVRVGGNSYQLAKNLSIKPVQGSTKLTVGTVRLLKSAPGSAAAFHVTASNGTIASVALKNAKDAQKYRIIGSAETGCSIAFRNAAAARTARAGTVSVPLTVTLQGGLKSVNVTLKLTIAE